MDMQWSIVKFNLSLMLYTYNMYINQQDAQNSCD